MTVAPHRQRGVALLVALLVVALAVILIAALLDRGELALARTRNVLRGEQAQAYAQGLEIYAAQILRKTREQMGDKDTNTSPWALPMLPQAVPGGTISASMRDLNGCFNLNNLSSKSGRQSQWQAAFRNLLDALVLDRNIAAAVSEWVNSGNVDNDGYYLAQPVPYRPRHDLFAHVSELRLVRGIDGDAYARLAPYVCVLPPGSMINLNTATPPILRSIDPERITAAVAQRLWQDGHAAFTDVNDFQTSAGPIQVPDALMYSVSSQYFLARGDVVLDDVPFAFFSLIERRREAIRTLARSRGSDDALAAPMPLDAAAPPAP